jgi:hypothetical protein
MANRRHHRAPPIGQLRLTIDCLPVATREAMLDGVQRSERIIAGAYVDGQGGVCPMLAAHRCGGRTDFLSFAKAWDRFTRAGRRVRQATAREVEVLVSQLRDSLMSEADLDLDHAIGEHRELVRRRERTEADPSGDIVARDRRARPAGAPPLEPPAQSASPGRTNIISGITHAGVTFSR